MNKQSKRTYKEMIQKINPHFPQLSIFMLLIIAMDSIKFFLSIAYENIISSVSDKNGSNLILFSIVALILILISGVAIKVFSIKKRVLVQKTTHKLQQEIIDRKMRESLLSSEAQDSGSWMTNLTSDCKALAGFFGNTQTALFSGVIQFGLAVLYGFSRSPKLTIIILLLSTLSFLMPKLLASAVSKTHQIKQVNDSVIRGAILDSVNKLPVIKAYRAGTFFVDKFSDIYKVYSKSAIDNVKAESKMNAFNIGIGFFMNTIWMIYGIVMVMQNELSFGVFVGFMNLGNSFNWPFFSLSELIAAFTREKVAYQRLYEVEVDLDMLKEIDSHVSINNIKEGVYVNNLSFSYSKNKEKIFNNETLIFNKGKHTAITGESGRGKSTLLKLIMGLYQPVSGYIGYSSNGETHSGNVLRNQMSYVPQGYSLFSGTIKENIEFGREGATFEEVQDAARKACADSFIMELENGYETQIGSGADVNLSQGQAIRVALARAILKNAEVFVLDEVTSALDQETEKAVLDNMKMYSNTLIMVTHKKVVMESCDEVIYL